MFVVIIRIGKRNRLKIKTRGTANIFFYKIVLAEYTPRKADLEKRPTDRPLTMSEEDKKPSETVPDGQGERSTNPESNSESQGNSPDWEEVSSDPDPQDLSYELSQWQRIHRSGGTQLIFLPTNEGSLHDQAFIILDKKGVCDLVRYR